MTSLEDRTRDGTCAQNSSQATVQFIYVQMTDTRILLGINDEEDTQMIQNKHKLYKLADKNNMKFNANKFELLRYGK